MELVESSCVRPRQARCSLWESASDLSSACLTDDYNGITSTLGGVALGGDEYAAWTSFATRQTFAKCLSLSYCIFCERCIFLALVERD